MSKLKKKPTLRIYCVSKRLLEYEEWLAKFESEIDAELAETGAKREMDFDVEREFDKRYEMYLNTR
jgi:hypothetical protein